MPKKNAKIVKIDPYKCKECEDCYMDHCRGKAVIRLERGTLLESFLTKKQKYVLKIAIIEGYFEIPRRITLTELALKLKIHKSSLSGIMRRIQDKSIRI